jgi:hypothetical protein
MVKEIIEGWANLTLDRLGKLDQETKEIAEYRLAHCTTCSMREGNTCARSKKGINVKTLESKKGCGCKLSAKTLSMSSKCPLGKW